MKPASKNRPPAALLFILLAIATFLLYWPVRHFEFLNFDDPSYVSANPHVFHGLSRAGFVWAFKSYDTNWHPVTWLSHMLDCQLFGHDAGLHHLMNLFFHVANTLLLFGLFRKLTGAIYRSVLVAALFAMHPLHVESVAWIAERKDVLSTFFGLGALLAYARYATPAKTGKPNSALWYCLTLALFALSLMSKPMLVTFPFLLLLLDFWPLKRLHSPALPHLLLEKLPFLFLSIADSIVTVIAQKSGEAVVDATRLSLGERVINAIMAYSGYLRKLVLPVDLAPYYPYQHHPPPGEVIIALLILVVVSAFALRMMRRAPYVLFGWLWYLGLLIPVIGLVQVGAQSMADRYTYLPLVGIFVICVWGIAGSLSGLKQRKIIAVISSAIVLIACAGVTRSQESYWHDSETLFRRDLELKPQDNAMAHHCLGRALFDRGDYTEAQPHFEEVLRLLPNFAPGHLNLANCLSRQGHYEEAMFHYREALRLKPKDPEIYKCFGTCLAAQMKFEAARTNFLAAIQYQPDYVEAYTKLAMVEMALGKPDEAFKHLTDAVAIYPDYHEAQYYLAHALADQRRFDEAEAHFRAAIKASPDYADALNDLARMWLTQADPKHINLNEAIQLAGRACELTQYKNAGFLETLGMAYSATGKFREAIEAAEKAIALAAAGGDQDTVAALQKELSFYRNGRSYSGTSNP